MEHSISIRNLNRRFGSIQAVNGLDLDVPRGSITGLLGPNGAGKTTTLHIIIGILRRHSGEVSVMGMDPDRQPVAIRTHTGFVMESPRAEPRFTVRRHLSFHRSFRPTWDDNLANDLVSRFRLHPKKPCHALSRGEQAKLALVCALAFRPRLLVLDDPTSGLDPLARHEFIDGILQVIAQEGRTVLFSTHVVDDIERVADRVIMMDSGKHLLADDLEHLHASMRAFRLSFQDKPAPTSLDVPGLLRWQPEGRAGLAIIADYSEACQAALDKTHALLEPMDLSLEDIYLEIVKARAAGGTP